MFAHLKGRPSGRPFLKICRKGKSMRKLTRSEKTKLIEKAKTLIIVLLLFLCFFLGYRILRLYKAQANVENALWGGGGSGMTDVMDSSSQYELSIMSELSQPEMIVLNSVQGRNLLEDKGNETFDKLAKLSNQIIGEFYRLKSDEVLGSSKEEWKNVLKSNSLYIRYPDERFLDFEKALYGIKDTGISDKIKSYTKVLIMPDNGEAEAVTVFIEEQNGESVVKARLSTENAKSIIENIKKLPHSQKKEYVFAHELNLDREGDKDKTVLEPMLLIPAGDEKALGIEVTVPRLYRAGLNFTKATDLTVGLINIFGYNPNTIRQYVNSDDSIMFVGETGSLSLHPEGMIEYKALDAEDGVALGLADGEDFKNIIFNLCGMLEKVMRISGINTNNSDFTVKMTSIPESYQFSSKTEIGFDYFVEGKKLEFLDSYGIWAVIQKGNLIELKMQLKSIERQNKQSLMGDMLNAIDEFCIENVDCKKINHVYGIYKYEKGTTELKAEWKVEGAK